MSEPITILIVDDHTVVRQGVRTLLGMHPDLQVVGEDHQAILTLVTIFLLRASKMMDDLHH